MSVTKVTLQNYADEVSRSEKPVLIDFYADWCGPCKMTAPELEAFSQEYDDVKVCKINVDESADLVYTDDGFGEERQGGRPPCGWLRKVGYQSVLR